MDYVVLPNHERHYIEGDVGHVSDGYHTFGELYEHRIALYIQLCRYLAFEGLHRVWRTELHSDGSRLEGWFLLGVDYDKGRQITYHLPISRWADCCFATPIMRAPDYDGHTSADVLERLKQL